LTDTPALARAPARRVEGVERAMQRVLLLAFREWSSFGAAVTAATAAITAAAVPIGPRMPEGVDVMRNAFCDHEQNKIMYYYCYLGSTAP